MPPIQTVEEAIQRAAAFLDKYYAFKRPLSAKRDGDSWRLVFDVGVFGTTRVRIAIDATTGAVTEYSAPDEV